MRLKRFLNSISNDFSDILKKYHCKGMIMPLLVLVLGFSYLSKVEASVVSIPRVSADREASASQTEIKKISAPNNNATVSLSKNYKAINTNITSVNTVQLAKATNPTYTPPNSITINGRVGVINFVSPNGNYLPVPSYNIGLFSGKSFLFGHRSSSIFSELFNLSTGSTITITLNDISKQYVVSRIDLEARVDLDDDNPDTEADNAYRRRIYNGVDKNGRKHSFALMTCAGTSLGGGDAIHRLLVFVDEI